MFAFSDRRPQKIIQIIASIPCSPDSNRIEEPQCLKGLQRFSESFSAATRRRDDEVMLRATEGLAKIGVLGTGTPTSRPSEIYLI